VIAGNCINESLPAPGQGKKRRIIKDAAVCKWFKYNNLIALFQPDDSSRWQTRASKTLSGKGVMVRDSSGNKKGCSLGTAFLRL
jgi:hypothetical protein